MIGPNYAGSTITVEMQFGTPPLTADDADTCVISIFDPTNVELVASEAMSFDAESGLWRFQWDSPPDGGNRTYLLQGLLTGLDASETPAWGTVDLELAPNAEQASPEGVVPATRHWLSAWCDESDIPPKRLHDSNGVPLTDVAVGWAICAATELLFYLGGGSRGRSGRTVCRPSSIVNSFGQQSYLYPYRSMSGYGSGWGFGSGWGWSMVGCGWWQTGSLSEVVLQGPVTRINSVMVDGLELDPSEYTLYDRRRLVRNAAQIGGATGGAWPWAQQLQLPVSSPGTWQIDYEWGSSPKAPQLARMAAAEVAIQLVLGFSGQDACKLPARVQQVATEGTSVAVGDALEFLKADLTGLPIVDQWLRAVNPSGRRRRSIFASPETVSRHST